MSRNPFNIFNVDETCLVCSQGTNAKVYARLDSKSPYLIEAQNQKEAYTINVCISASGEYLPLYVVYQSTSLRSNWFSGGPAGCRYNCSESGWMNEIVFLDWFRTVFVEHCKKLPGNKFN